MIGSQLYTFGSILATIIVISNAYVIEEQFYSTVIHIVRSKAILLVLFNFGIVISVQLFKAIIFAFFGALKPAETQHMQSQSIRHGFQLLIFLYLLNIEFDWFIAAHIVLNIAVASLHTLAIKRVEYLFTERYPKMAYFRMVFLHVSLMIVDYFLINMEMKARLYENLSIFLYYEYILMLLEIIKSLILFWINAYEWIKRPEGWDTKADIIRVVEFAFNILTLCIVLAEFLILSKKSAAGIYFIEKSLKSVLNIYTCLAQFLESKRLLGKVERFPDASPEEIHHANDKCIFCLEHLTHAKKINCGHLFHYKCLRDYFQTSSNPVCPTCRADIDETFITPQKKSEQMTQILTSSLIVQDLPEGFPLGNPLNIGAVPWGLPQPVNSHRISKHTEQMRKGVEGINSFMVRFYKHPPDELEIEEEAKEEIKTNPNKIREKMLKRFENKDYDE